MTIARGFGICQMCLTSQTERSIIDSKKERKEADVMHHIPTIAWWKSRI